MMILAESVLGLDFLFLTAMIKSYRHYYMPNISFNGATLELLDCLAEILANSIRIRNAAQK